jgi:YihY family inner membrane protein
VFPGATLATFSWFASTMFYGWYVTRFADYSIVYGPLGAGIATMVWLYIVSLAVLIGAEYNALQPHAQADTLTEAHGPAASPQAEPATASRLA